MTRHDTAGGRTDEWLIPNGVDCPVGEDVVVDIIRRDGSEDCGPAGYWNASYSQRHFSSWFHNKGNCDVVKYRIAALAKTGGAA